MPVRKDEKMYNSFDDPGRQLTLMDAELSAALKEQGMQQASRNADQQWKDRFDKALQTLAAAGTEFTSEDVTAVTGLPPSGSPSAVGARMNAAAKRGLIVRVGLRNARRAKSHAAMLLTWKGSGENFFLT